MKTSMFFKPSLLASCALACAGVIGAFLLAGGSAPVASQDTLTVLSRVSVPELPTAAARLVAQAAPEARSATAVAVVRAASALVNSSTLPFVVGSISETTPEVAATVVCEAARLQPEAGLACVKSATIAAPSQTAEIVAQAVRQQPASYSQVALIAAQVAPTRSAEILSGLSSGLPQVQSFVSRAASQADVATIIGQVNQMVVSAAQSEIAAARSQFAVVGAATTPAQPVYTPLISSTQKGPPLVTPLTPPIFPGNERTPANSTAQSGYDRDYSAP